MTRETIIYRICDRCAAEKRPREVNATVTDRVNLNGHRYDIDLCEKCSAELYAAIMHWCDMGTKTGEPRVLDKAPAPKTTHVPLPAAKPMVPQTVIDMLPDSAHQWTFSEHALDRWLERGLDRAEVLMACERPERVEPTDNPGEQKRIRGACTAVVNPHERRVITVYDHTRKDDQSLLTATSKGA